MNVFRGGSAPRIERRPFRIAGPPSLTRIKRRVTSRKHPSLEQTREILPFALHEHAHEHTLFAKKRKKDPPKVVHYPQGKRIFSSEGFSFDFLRTNVGRPEPVERGEESVSGGGEKEERKEGVGARGEVYADAAASFLAAAMAFWVP